MKLDIPFYYDATTALAGDAFIAKLSGGIRTKDELLYEISKRLLFPDYFGGNWDALEECMRDLSWLPTSHIVVTHVDLPLVENAENLKIYLDVLRSAVHKLSKFSGRKLEVIFPATARARIEWLLQ